MDAKGEFEDCHLRGLFERPLGRSLTVRVVRCVRYFPAVLRPPCVQMVRGRYPYALFSLFSFVGKTGEIGLNSVQSDGKSYRSYKPSSG